MQQQQKNAQQIRDAANTELVTFQKENAFPADQVPGWFGEVVRESLRTVCPASVNISIEDFTSMYRNETGNYTLFDMGTLLQIVRSRTAEQLRKTVDEYIDLQEKIGEMSNEWFRIYNPKRKEVDERATQETQNLINAARTPSAGQTIQLPAENTEA